MTQTTATAEVNIHLRARPADRDLIDRAAELVGANRSQFMLASAVKEAKAVLLDQTTLTVNTREFNAILDRLDATPSPEESAGLSRLMGRAAPWGT